MDPLTFDYAGTAQRLRDVRDLVAEVVVTCSVIANFMPKVEGVTNPIAKRMYQAVVNTVAFCALNWRKRLPALQWHIWPFRQEKHEG